MDQFVDERDFQATQPDASSFHVLRRVMTGPCTVLLTDHERLIVCYTASPFPVWIWTAADASEEEMARAYETAAEAGLLDGTHLINLRPELMQYFIQRGLPDGRAAVLRGKMLVYECPRAISPGVAADGNMRRCTAADTDKLVDVLERFHAELGLDERDRAAYREDVVNYLEEGNVFFWRNEDEIDVACCRTALNDDGTAWMTLVYTDPAYRRRHYAQNLVYQATHQAAEAGHKAFLYADANYPASNACYRGIGYIPCGEVYTVGGAADA